MPTVISPPVSWKSHMKKHPRNTYNESSSAGACYILHAILVVIHVVLVIFYMFRWEHRVTLPFTQMNTDFWPVVLSASLQAFYTVRDLLYLPIGMPIKGLHLDLHGYSTLPHPTACDIKNASTPSEINYHSRYMWCMGGPWLCTQ